jgi:hypothetical protein
MFKIVDGHVTFCPTYDNYNGVHLFELFMLMCIEPYLFTSLSSYRPSSINIDIHLLFALLLSCYSQKCLYDRIAIMNIYN